MTPRSAGQLGLPPESQDSAYIREYYRGLLEPRAEFDLTTGRHKILEPRLIIHASSGTILEQMLCDLMAHAHPHPIRWRKDALHSGKFTWHGERAWRIADYAFGHLPPIDIPSPLRERVAEVFQWRAAAERHQQLVRVARDYGWHLARAPLPEDSDLETLIGS
jgi:hypothetical protein